MCLRVHTKTVCGSCGKDIAAQTDDAWCSAARKKGEFGRCPRGVREEQGESRGLECEPCAAVRQAAMDELEMEDFAENRLGWKGKGKGKMEDEGKGKGKEKERERDEEDSDDVGGFEDKYEDKYEDN
ncbi:hypothetical protein F4775DRAFT_588749 [Biscogniauxia sp. FL1348]|nr:hypothetical protein F4775DRAFT_588749 [Biscogniauxia sp. FL1348]